MIHRYCCDFSIFATLCSVMALKVYGKTSDAGSWKGYYHTVINTCLLGCVPTALCFAMLVKLVRLQTRTKRAGFWHRLARLLRINRGAAAKQLGQKQRREARAFEMYCSGIHDDDDTDVLLKYFEKGNVEWVFVSSPEELHTGELVMDWLVEACHACPCRFKQGFDWASSGNS